MKTIIAGGREFNDYDLLEQYCNTHSITEVVSGCARGADRLGERYANKHDIPITKFPADWDKWGKSAGYRRNAEMASYADSLIAFWDGVSKGTSHMIDLANSKKLDVNVIKYWWSYI